MDRKAEEEGGSSATVDDDNEVRRRLGRAGGQTDFVYGTLTASDDLV